MKGYFISRVIGDGTLENAFRLAISDHAAVSGCSAVIPCDTDGRPKYGYGLAVVTGEDLTQIDTGGDIIQIPRVDLATNFSDLPRDPAQTLRSRLDAIGLAVAVDANTTVHDLIRQVGRQLNADFEPLKVSVRDG